MNYSYLKLVWANPLPNEREIYNRKVIEIHGARLVYLILIALLLIVTAIFSKLYVLIIIPNIIFILLFPLFVTPWDLILSDKRLLLRKRYWMFGKFSKILSINLDNIESLQFSPRLKAIPLTIGFFVIESLSLVMIEYALTDVLPLPLIIQIVLFFVQIFNLGLSIKSNILNITELMYLPFYSVALFVGITTLVIGIALILLGLPYRTSFSLSIDSGHSFTINAGVPRELTKLISSFYHKKLLEGKTQFWDLKIPLLKGEKIYCSAKVALVNHKTQFISFISLYFFLSSISHIIELIYNPSFLSLFILPIYGVNFVIIIVALRFSKRYQQIVVTKYRIIFEDEYSQISGLGKRLYQYHDIPLKNIQGFRVSNYTNFTLYSFFGIILLFILGLYLFSLSSSYEILLLTLLMMLLYGIYNYRIFTSLNIVSEGGKQILYSYEIPVFWKRISEYIEYGKSVYSILFYNILHESKIAEILNYSRGISDPRSIIKVKGKQKLSYKALLSIDEEILNKWDNIRPAPYYRLSIIIGGIFSMISILILVNFINNYVKVIFIIVSLFIVLITLSRRITVLVRTLIITKKRIIYVLEMKPRRIAVLLGKLPEWTVIENLKKHVEIVNLKLNFQPKYGFYLINDIIYIITGFIFMNLTNQSPNGIFMTIFIIFDLLVAFLIVIKVLSLSSNFTNFIPRFSINIQMRSGNILLPYLHDFNKIKEIMNR